MTSATTERIWLPDAAAAGDLATFVGRGRRVDPDGAARLVGHGDVLAVYVSPVHGAGGPTVLGLRTLALAEPTDLDVTVSLAALADRFPRLPAGAGAGADPQPLAVPPVQDVATAWAGTAPPRSGWQAGGTLDPAALRDAAQAGAQEIVAGAPEGSGAAAVARLRAQVWSRPMQSAEPSPAGAPPAGAAFAADALGFLAPDEPVALYRSGPWWRLTTARGHVLARRPAF